MNNEELKAIHPLQNESNIKEYLAQGYATSDYTGAGRKTTTTDGNYDKYLNKTIIPIKFH